MAPRYWLERNLQAEAENHPNGELPAIRMTTVPKLALAAAYLALSLYGLYKLKTAAVGVNLDYAAGFISYCAGFLLWLLILRIYPLSFAFPLAAGLLVCGTQVIGLVVLHESFGPLKAIGSMMIVAGLAFVAIADGIFKNG